MVAEGSTTTLTVNADPLQLPGVPVGVILYVAVTTLAVILVRLSLRMLCPAPEDAPLKPKPPGDAQE